MGKFGEKSLLGAFAVLILLTIGIGAIGIWEIKNLSRRIEKLGTHNLILEKAILEMKINDTVYAMGIRNYVFWKVSHYLGAVPMAINLDNIFAASSRFRAQLAVYKNNIYSEKQKEWVKQIEDSFEELADFGRQIVDLSGRERTAESDENIKNLLMVFENRVYKIDNFLDNLMGKENLSAIEQQLIKTDSDKRNAILFLVFTIISAVSIGSLIAVTVYRHRKRDRRYRQQLINQLINMEENERKNLSAQIHDQMGQDLSGLKIYLGIIEQGLVCHCRPAVDGTPQNDRYPDIKEKLAQCKKIISDLIDKSHNIAFLLRPPALDEVGLVDSLEALLLDCKHLTGVHFTYEKPVGELNLSSEYSLLLYRIGQELLTNMAKHSKAKNVQVRLHKNTHSVEFAYKDDGIGFQYDKIISLPRRRKEDKFKLGLSGLKERVELLGGLMQVDTALGKGTKVTIKLSI